MTLWALLLPLRRYHSACTTVTLLQYYCNRKAVTWFRIMLLSYSCRSNCGRIPARRFCVHKRPQTVCDLITVGALIITTGVHQFPVNRAQNHEHAEFDCTVTKMFIQRLASKYKANKVRYEPQLTGSTTVSTIRARRCFWQRTGRDSRTENSDTRTALGRRWTDVFSKSPKSNNVW